LHLCQGCPGPLASNLHFLCSWADRRTQPYTAFIGWDGGLTNFLPWPASNFNPPE
jgi:hypothetical protein